MVSSPAPPLSCCLACHRRLPQASPYCAVCGQRLLPPQVLENSPALLESSRFQLAPSGVVWDRHTGLYWQQGGSSYPLRHGAAVSYFDDLNRRNFGGRRDWRLPSLPELASLLAGEKTVMGLYIDAVFDPRQIICWTATPSPAGGAYGVLFYPGAILAQSLEHGAFFRAVAGEVRTPLPVAVPDQQILELGRSLLFDQGKRRLPTKKELEDYLKTGGLFSDLILDNARQLYFLPTKEFARALIRLFRHLGVARVVEVGAGDGFLAAAVQAQDFPVVPTDILSQSARPVSGIRVHQAGHLEAIKEFQPELVFWCWPPMASTAPAEIIQSHGLRFYLDIGDGGFATGTHDLVARFGGRYLATLSNLGFTRLDAGPYRHNRCFLFKAGGE